MLTVGMANYEEGVPYLEEALELTLRLHNETHGIMLLEDLVRCETLWHYRNPRDGHLQKANAHLEQLNAIKAKREESATP